MFLLCISYQGTWGLFSSLQNRPPASLTTTTARGPTTLMRTLAGFCSSAIILEFRFQFLKKKAIVIWKSPWKVHFHLNRGISGDVDRCNIDLDEEGVSLGDIPIKESSDIFPSVFYHCNSLFNICFLKVDSESGSCQLQFCHNVPRGGMNDYTIRGIEVKYKNTYKQTLYTRYFREE